MTNKLASIALFLFLILTLLLVVCLGKSWLFYVAKNTRNVLQLANGSELIFYIREKEIVSAKNPFLAPLKAEDFLSGIYSVNNYQCYLAVQIGQDTLYYWWFLEPFVNRIVLLPAPALWDRPLPPSLVFPDILVWQREINPQLYPLLKQALGTDQNVHNIADTCKVRPSMYVF